MSPLQVLQMPNYNSTWSQLSVFTDKLVGAYKQAQQNKWDNELNGLIISAIDKAGDKNESDDLITKLNSPSPTIDIEGATKAANSVMGMLQKKEVMTGGITKPAPEPNYGSGNIDLNNRPVYKVPGKDEVRTVNSMSFEENGKEILVSTIINGQQVSNEEAINHYHQTGEFLGKFDSIDEANKYAEQLHLDQQKQYATPPKTELLPDQKEWNEVYKIFSGMSGEVTNWDEPMNFIKQRLDSGRQIGSQAQAFLNMILGQKQKDPRDEIAKNIDLTNAYMKAMNPETKEPTDYEKYLMDKEGFLQYKKDVAEAGREPEKPTEWDKKLDIIMQLNPSNDELKKLLGIYIAPENQSDFDKKYNLIMKTNPTPNELKKFLGTYIEPKTGTGAKTPTSPFQMWLLQHPDGTYDEWIKDSKTSTTKTLNIDKILFGNTGIIPKYIQTDIESSGTIAEEYKETVRKNFKLKESSLSADELTDILAYFQQIEFDPYYIEPEPAPTPEPVKTNKVGEFWKKLTTPITETPMYLGKKEDQYGYVLGELKDIDGKKYKYAGNDQWQPL